MKDNKLCWSVCGLCICVVLAGCTYDFGVISPVLTSSLGFQQKELDMIASVGNIGLYMSLCVGYALQYIGFHAVIYGGGVLVFTGLLHIWLSVQHVVAANFYSIAFFYFLAQAGSCCHIAGSVSTVIYLCPAHMKGTVVGLVKGYFGLSSGLLAAFASTFFQNDPSSFVLFCAVLIPIAGGVGASLVQLDKADPVDGHHNFTQAIVAHWFLLFTLLLVSSTFLAYLHVNSVESIVIGIIILLTICLLVGVPLYKIREAYAVQQRDRQCDSNGEHCDAHEIMPLLARVNRDSVDHKKTMELEPTTVTSVPLKQAVRTWRLWGLCYVYFACSGAGLMVIYNINSIALACGVERTAYFVGLVALANGLGRITAGLGADHLWERYGFTGAGLLAVVALVLSIVQCVLSLALPELLLPAVLCSGFLFGCTTCLIAVSVAEAFGTQHIATNFGLVDTSPMLGSFVFAALVVNGFYHTNALDEDGENVCVGRGCFQTAFLISAAACAIASTVACRVAN